MEQEEGPRLVYSGLVLFAAKILSVGTGMIFTLMITRTVPVEEYGIWVNVNLDIIMYFTLLASAIPFWTMRFVARKHEGSAKTGVISNFILALVSAAIYVALTPFILSALGVSEKYLVLYLVAGFQVIEIYLIRAFEAVLRVIKIEALGYGLLIAEIIKVVVAYFLIIRFGLGLIGAMFGLVIAFLIQIFYYLRLSWSHLRGRIVWGYFKEWLKGSLINIYNVVGFRLSSFSLILLFAIAGEAARAYYGASTQIASVIGYSSFLAFALYPRLLMGKGEEDVAMSIKLFFMFAIPMTVGAILFADSYLIILDVKYAVAVEILQLMAVLMLIRSFCQVLDFVIFGTEHFDLKAKIPFAKLVKSRLFAVFSLPFINAGIVLPLTYFVLTTMKLDPLSSAFYTVIIMLVASMVLLGIRCVLVRKSPQFVFPWVSILKYVVASAVMAIFLLVIPHPKRLSITLLYTVVAGAIYFLTLMLIEEEARELVKLTFREIKMKFRKFR